MSTSLQHHIRPDSASHDHTGLLLDMHSILDTVVSLVHEAAKDDSDEADNGIDRDFTVTADEDEDGHGTTTTMRRRTLARVLECILLGRRADEKVLEVLGWLGVREEDEDADADVEEAEDDVAME